MQIVNQMIFLDVSTKCNRNLNENLLSYSILNIIRITAVYIIIKNLLFTFSVKVIIDYKAFNRLLSRIFEVK